MNQSLSIYSQAKQALAEYKTVDEVKDYRDKALAIEAYAKQAKDYELEHDAACARVRAERKCGELLADMEKAKGMAGGAERDSSGRMVRPLDDQPKTLSEMGITKDQSSKYQKLAQVPEKDFEAALNEDKPPSTNRILNPKLPSQPKPKMNPHALWWWGTLKDLERDGRLSCSLDDLLGEMTDAMRKDAERIIPLLTGFLA